MSKKKENNRGKPEASRKNLKPVKTKKEARELGSKGGKASGKAKKEKKALKERLELAGEILTNKLKKAALEQKDKVLAKEIEEIGGIVYNLLELATSKKVKSETRLRALSEIMDRTDGKAVQRNEHSGPNGIPIESVQFTPEELNKWYDDLRKDD